MPIINFISHFFQAYIKVNNLKKSLHDVNVDSGGWPEKNL
jgi:hypothetical protein